MKKPDTLCVWRDEKLFVGGGGGQLSWGPKVPLSKIENSSDLASIFFLVKTQTHEQGKNIKNKKMTHLGDHLSPERVQLVLQDTQKHERTHPRAEWVTKGKKSVLKFRDRPFLVLQAALTRVSDLQR